MMTYSKARLVHCCTKKIPRPPHNFISTHVLHNLLLLIVSMTVGMCQIYPSIPTFFSLHFSYHIVLFSTTFGFIASTLIDLFVKFRRKLFYKYGPSFAYSKSRSFLFFQLSYDLHSITFYLLLIILNIICGVVIVFASRGDPWLRLYNICIIRSGLNGTVSDESEARCSGYLF